ncbi:MAG TPA: TssQ family T6SS-associated lipoprotein [Burkholderiales bacterium]|jgi:Tfp pilus assembly protein PilF|nr:TssQ family T6SS-associated lipoprotein [Burkholderiales bacterium]
MRRLTLAAVLLAALAGCASLEKLVQATKAQVTLVEGLRQYDAGNHEAATKSLNAALKLGLGKGDQATAHKHLAFIQCSAGREPQCRDEFRKALAAVPKLQLEPEEVGHPVWGPIFLSMSGGSAFSVGLKQYEAGEYTESAKNLQGAISLGLPDRQRADAHKYLAFIHCAENRERQCRDEFRKALAVNPGLELAPVEAGHPVWGPIFQSVKSGR